MTSSRYPAYVLPRAFPGISAEEVQLLIHNARVQKYPAGTVLCREGEKGNTFYIILDGEADVTKRINEHESRLLSILHSGDFFGEMALIHNAPRVASVQARTNLTVMEIGREEFEKTLKNSTAVAMAMVREISERLRTNDEMAIEELRMRATELAQAYQKLAEEELVRRELIKGIVRELQQPIRAALNYADFLGRENTDIKAMREAAQLTRQQIKRIAYMLDNLAYLQENIQDVDSSTSLDLREIIRQATQAAEKIAARQKIKLRVKTPLRYPRASGNAEALQRAFYASLDSLIHASLPGSQIILRLGQQNHEAQIQLEASRLSIDVALLNHLFAEHGIIPHAENEASPMPLLGLLLARQIIRQHNGYIEARQQGKRIVITFHLPIL